MLKIFDFQPREYRLVFSFLFFIILINLFFTISITVAETLFLSKFNSKTLQELLPWIYIGTAFVTVLITWLYDKIIDKFSRMNVIVFIEIAFAISFLVLRFFVSVPAAHSWVYFVLMLWADACSLFNLTLFYSYMGDYFSVRDAKRVYAFITTGLPIGAFIGGFAVIGLVKFMAIEDLLYTCAVLLLLCIVNAYYIYIHGVPIQHTVSIQHTGPTDSEHSPTFFKKMFGNQYIALIFLIVTIESAAWVLAQYQLMVIANKTLNEEQIAVFFGKLYGYSGCVQFFIQIFVANWLLRRFGLMNSNFALPVLLLLTGSLFALNPTFSFVAIMLFVFLTLDQTLDQLIHEVMFLPLATRLRIHAQAFADGILYPGGKVIAGLCLLTFALMKAPIHIYTLLFIGLTIIWIGAAIALIPQYKRVLAKTINDHIVSSLDLKTASDELKKILSGTESVPIVAKLFDNLDPQSISTLLTLLPDNISLLLKPSIKKLAQSTDANLAAQALHILGQQKNKKDQTFILPFLHDERQEVSSAAILAYCQLAKSQALPEVKQFLDSQNLAIRLVALTACYNYCGQEGKRLVEQRLDVLMENDRVTATKAIGDINAPTLYEKLKVLLVDPQEIVRHQAIIACRKARDPVFLPGLLNNLINDKSSWPFVLPVLYTMPASALPHIISALQQSELPEAVHCCLLRAIVRIDNDIAIKFVLDTIMSKPKQMTFITATQSLQQLSADMGANEEISAEIKNCLTKISQDFVALRQGYNEMGDVPPAVKQIFSDAIELYFSIIFALLSIQYGIKEIAMIPDMLASSDLQLRDNSLELLEAALPHATYLEILKLCIPPAQDIDSSKAKSLQETSEILLNIDPWIRSLTIYSLSLLHPNSNIQKEYSMSIEEKELLQRINTIILLKQIELFGAIPANYLISLAEIVYTESYLAGDIIFNQGDAGDSLYLINKGKVSIKRDDHEVTQLGPGECIGELAILDRLPRSATVIALEDIELLRIFAHDFDNVLITYPEVGQSLLQILARRLRASIDKPQKTL